MPLVGVEVADLSEGVALDHEPLVVAVDHAQVFQGLGVAVELMGGGEGVEVEVRPMPELSLQRGPVPFEQALGLHVLLADLGLALDDDGDLHLRLHHIQLGLQAPGLFQCDLQGLDVVILHDVPVDVQDAGVQLGVDHAVAAQAGALILALLPVVEPDHQIAVDLLHFSHFACPSFLRSNSWKCFICTFHCVCDRVKESGEGRLI